MSSPEGKLTHEQLNWWCPVVLMDRKEEEKMYRKCPKGLLGVELKEVDKYQFFEQEIVQWDNSDDDSRVLALKKDSSDYYKRS